MEGKVECNLCGRIRHLRPQGTLVCEDCDLYKAMITSIPPLTGRNGGAKRWWQIWRKDDDDLPPTSAK